MSEIIFLMGKSATGKDSIYKELANRKELALKTVTPYTTRPMRQNETEGVEYFFVSDKMADDLQEAGTIIEIRSYHTVNGLWRYFTADDGQINLKKREKYLMIGTLEAYTQVASYYGKEHILPIYIETDDKVRLLRAIAREEQQEHPNYAELCRRFLADEKDFQEEKLAAAEVKRVNNNGSLAECIAQIEQLLKEENTQTDC